MTRSICCHNQTEALPAPRDLFQPTFPSMPSEHQDAPWPHLTMRIVGNPRDREIIPRSCGGFATIGPANLSFFRHQGASLLSFAFVHGTIKRRTPASQPAVGAIPQ